MDIVSVLVPLYNNENYIECALNSLLQENTHHIELLVLDDGSSDSSLAIATSWLSGHHDKFYKVKIWSQSNKGISATLNKLIINSTGEYLTILPADDELLPGGIAARLSVLRNNPDILCVFGDAVVVDDTGTVLSESSLFNYPKKHVAPHSWALHEPKLLALEMIIRWAVPGPVFLAHKKAFFSDSGVGLYDEGLAAEDRDFYLRSLSRNVLAYVDYKVANYRVHGTNVSTHENTSPSIKKSVIDSERRNLERFSGINRIALYVVYRYKQSVSLMESSTDVLERMFYMMQAAATRMLMRLFDFIQLMKKAFIWSLRGD